jgi:hypothetical protein
MQATQAQAVAVARTRFESQNLGMRLTGQGTHMLHA